MPAENLNNDIRIVPTTGCADCGGRCLQKVYVKDGIALKAETDDGEEPQLRCCVRGRALRKQLYAPDRLLFPLRRTGARGSGEFKRVSWDEALDTVAKKLKYVKDTYGNQSILLLFYSMTGVHTPPYRNSLSTLLLNFGGFMLGWGGASMEASVFASRATYGTLITGNTRDDHVNSSLIILWGVNPAESIFSTNTAYYLLKAKEAGARIIHVDPRFTRTTAVLADQWIPIRPSTDTAMMVAMAYVMITENLQDQAFLDKYTVGFDKFSEYVLGIEDGVAKTPEWAEVRTGVPAQTITALAREYATVKPAALIPGFAPGRTAYGEQFHRAASVLAAMTGNVGIHGGGAAGFERGPLGNQFAESWTKQADSSPTCLDIPHQIRNRFHFARIWDLILQGTAGGYPSDIKLFYVSGANPLNQFPNINKGIEAMQKLEFTVVHEQFMTATARYADIVLPIAHPWEKIAFARPWLSGPYFLYGNRVVKPPAEVKTDHEIAVALAPRLGLSAPLRWNMPEDEALQRTIETAGDVKVYVTDFKKFKEEGVHKIKITEPVIAFEEQIKDPANHPFPTPSGKIEIYCQRLADLNNPELPPIPKYIESWEGPADPLRKKYPLHLLTFHHRTRANSTYDNIPWLRALEPQSLLINAKDAEVRHIKNGDMVRAFNDRGETILPAKVTQRIMPGVIAIGQGAWYHPDGKGRDRAGSVNILTRDAYSPGGGFPYNTCLIQVEKFSEE